MVDTPERKENNAKKINQKATTELLMELIEKSEGYITESAKWTMRGTYATLILCSLSVALLVSTPIMDHVGINPFPIEIFVKIVLFCQIWLVIWWSIFLYHGKKDIKETMAWWNQNIKPLKDRDVSMLLK